MGEKGTKQTVLVERKGSMWLCDYVRLGGVLGSCEGGSGGGSCAEDGRRGQGIGGE